MIKQDFILIGYLYEFFESYIKNPSKKPKLQWDENVTVYQPTEACFWRWPSLKNSSTQLSMDKLFIYG